MEKLLRVGTVLVIALLLGLVGFRYWRTRNISRVQRGYQVASEKGCFTCHGPGGLKGAPNPGHGLGDVPTFTGGILTMYAETEEEIREWILDGITRKLAADSKQVKLRETATVEMPAWRGLVTSRELEDMVAYIKAVSDFEKPQDEPALEGRNLARKLGCFGCHGPQGRGSMPNVRAFKGYIPSWDGSDFLELAKNDEEIREWILDGTTRRFAESSLARFFLSRQPIKMPAYRDQVSKAELDRLVDYIHWLRQHPY